MKNKLCLIVCETFKDEIQSVVFSEKLGNIVVETIPCICYKSGYRNADEIKCIMNRHSNECSHFQVIGGVCNKRLKNPDDEIENCHTASFDQCFYMLTNKTIVDNYISEGSYLTTPGWLKYWKDYVKEWGFSRETAEEFFKENSKQILLLDTGIDSQSSVHLKEFSEFIGLPCNTLKVGVDYLQMLILKTINNWGVQNKEIINEMVFEDKLKTEFFANISHEFRTPLNVILGIIQLFELHQKNGSLTSHIDMLDKYIPAMKQNCYRLLRLIDNLIDITRIDSGYFQIHPENQNIVDIIKNITLSVEDYMKTRGLSITFDTDMEKRIIACDRGVIERVFLNLVSNAIKFTEPGGEITVNIYNQNDKVAIVVADTGVGIPKNKQNLIFERFKQIDKSLTRKNEGSGIGLSIVKSLVEMHQGSISVKSNIGKGSRFTVLLPADISDKKYQTSGDTRIYLMSNQVEKIKIEFSDIY